MTLYDFYQIHRLPVSSPTATADLPRLEPAPLQIEASDDLVRTVLSLLRAAGVDESAELSGDWISLISFLFFILVLSSATCRPSYHQKSHIQFFELCLSIFLYTFSLPSFPFTPTCCHICYFREDPGPNNPSSGPCKHHHTRIGSVWQQFIECSGLR